MSLLDNAFTTFTRLKCVIIPDGYGGQTTTWTENGTFLGAIVHGSARQTIVAQGLGSTSNYTLTVRKDTELDYHEVIRRESDLQVFRLTSNSDDLKTPDGAGLNMRQYTAEAWRLTDNE